MPPLFISFLNYVNATKEINDTSMLIAHTNINSIFVFSSTEAGPDYKRKKKMQMNTSKISLNETTEGNNDNGRR